MSPSIGLGIPVIPLTSQGRMRNFLSKAGLSNIAIDVKTIGFGEELATRAVALLQDSKSFRELTREAVLRMREQTRICNASIFSVLGFTLEKNTKGNSF